MNIIPKIYFKIACRLSLMTSLIAMFMALLIFVLLFPYSLLVEDEADRGNASLRMKRMSAPGPMSHVPGMPEELRARWDTDGS